jgi:hypothetical protein
MPRSHGGAALAHIPFNLPAFKGLNSQAKSAVVGPEWATVLANTVIDDNNRIAARKGWLKTTTAALGSAITQMTVYDNAGTEEIIAVTSGNTLHKSNDDGATWSTITGTATVTDDQMEFIELAGSLLGLQAGGGTVLLYTGTSFSNLGATSEPTGGVGLAAFGRVWIKDTATTLKYSALLDETDFTGTDTGSFDLTSVWGEPDEIMALENFNGALVIFGKKNIVVYADGSGSVLGMDPLQAYVADIIRGVGCVARDTVVNVKGDLWFLDDTGVHSLGRLIQERSNPINNISKNVQDEVIDRLNLIADKSTIRAVYSPKDRFYLLSLPQGSGTTESGATIVFDTRAPLQDGTHRCVGIWTQLVPRAMVVMDDLDLITSLQTFTGEVGRYTGYLDDTLTYGVDYESAWLDLDSPVLKILKRVSGIFSVGGETVINFKWGFDFVGQLQNSAQATFSGGTLPDEWGIAEYGIAEYGAGAAALENKVGGKGTGEFVKIGFTTTINNVSVAAQQIALYAKTGRMR